MKKRIFIIAKWLALALWILVAGFCYSCGMQEDALLLTADEETEHKKAEDVSAGMESTVCMVHVCGEVEVPGVYELREGQRIFEAVELAGGFTDTAADSYLNLAQPVSDGMKIEVPSQEEAESLQQVSGGSKSGLEKESFRINLNTATKAQLMTLSGIGEARAEAIMQYRLQHGPFQKIEDIMQVSGIKESAFQKIKEEITVTP